ncbi:MAG: 3-isopropylmalate dehydratase small subunit [Gemmatimonadota bacterium]
MRVVVLPIDNIDTDQIIPARFLTVTGKDQLADGLFADWPQRPERGAEVLIAGHNFGCGSSREHAVWALQSYGFKAVISTEFADIFRNNALGNGLLAIQLESDAYERVRAATDLEVDLAAQTVTTADGYVARFPIDPFAKHCLLQATDALGYLLSADAEIADYEATNAR